MDIFWGLSPQPGGGAPREDTPGGQQLQLLTKQYQQNTCFLLFSNTASNTASNTLHIANSSSFLNTWNLNGNTWDSLVFPLSEPIGVSKINTLATAAARWVFLLSWLLLFVYLCLYDGLRPLLERADWSVSLSFIVSIATRVLISVRTAALAWTRERGHYFVGFEAPISFAAHGERPLLHFHLRMIRLLIVLLRWSVVLVLVIVISAFFKTCLNSKRRIISIMPNNLIASGANRMQNNEAINNKWKKVKLSKVKPTWGSNVHIYCLIAWKNACNICTFGPFFWANFPLKELWKKNRSENKKGKWNSRLCSICIEWPVLLWLLRLRWLWVWVDWHCHSYLGTRTHCSAEINTVNK